MKSHFHMKEWAPRLALRKRLKVIRKWPIAPLKNLTFTQSDFRIHVIPPGRIKVLNRLLAPSIGV